jgi:hypothetical protein
VRKCIAALILILSWSALAEAQELLLAQTTPPRLEWSYQLTSGCTIPTPTVDVQTSTTFGGTFTTVVQLPITATTYLLPTTANNLHYRISNPCGNSNIVQYVQAPPPPTGPTIEQRLTTVETSVAALRLADQSLSSANVAQDTALAALAGRVAVLETEVPPPPAPVPTSNFTVTIIDADHIRIVCNGTAIDTTGRGTQRVLECIH